ncbi:integrase [Acinetobacter sp. Ac_3412]|uniref:tyrosine-type recombinase/integrase n=1 Tax=Acinetobacter sp. Ac_3412 TaxID=1848935 RepID=UPI00148F915B|nr:integrase arm-type DNA-binding domain-containing protein [Acinetobacter sp. Ac_3412]NNP77698.1 integrase [Acinetobacter sp. Ac_3412]
MAIKVKPLSDTKCSSAKPTNREYSLHDGDGLYLLVRASGTKSWQFKYKNKITNKVVKLSVGTYPDLSLSKAREKRAEFKKYLAEGLDPKQQREIQFHKQNNSYSLENVTRSWLDSYALKSSLSADTKHKRLRKFENHLFPKFINKTIDQIGLNELRAALNQIYTDSPDNAQRIRSDLISIFSYAVQHNIIGFNSARELGGMDLSAQKNHRATFKELESIPELMNRIKADNGRGLTKLFLQFALHTFARSSELRFARWSEVNFDKKQWVIPATRDKVEGIKHSSRGAKMKSNHIVPLSPQAIILLEEIQKYSGNCDKVFPSLNDKDNFLSENTPNDALRRMGYSKDEISLHGFRALARSALGEMSVFQKDALEKQMSHEERNNTVGAYTHIAQYIEERIKIMNAWSDWLETIEQKAYITPYEYAQRNFIDKQN